MGHGDSERSCRAQVATLIAGSVGVVAVTACLIALGYVGPGAGVLAVAAVAAALLLFQLKQRAPRRTARDQTVAQPSEPAPTAVSIDVDLSRLAIELERLLPDPRADLFERPPRARCPLGLARRPARRPSSANRCAQRVAGAR